MELIVSACRTLANRQRLRLLRAIHDRPGQPVHALATTVKLTPDAVSHQLKPLCDYHFIRAAPSGRRVCYHPALAGATSHPFLRGMQRLVEEAVRVAGQIRTPEKVCEFDVKGWEEELVKLFTTYTHLRRLLILRYLSAHGGTPIATLAEKIGMSPDAAYRHLDKLLRRGVVVCIGKAPAHWGVAPVSGDVWRTKLLALVLREFKSYRTTTAA